MIVSALNVAVVSGGAAAVFFLGLRFGLSARRSAILAAVALVLAVASAELGSLAASTDRIAIVTTGHPSASAAQRAASLPPSAAKANGSIDDVSVTPATSGKYDTARHEVTAKRTSTITLRGWAVDADAHGTGSGIIAFVDGEYSSMGSYGSGRADVAAALGSGAYTQSGFSIEVAMNRYAGSHHTVTIGLITADGASYEPLPVLTKVNLR